MRTCIHLKGKRKLVNVVATEERRDLNLEINRIFFSSDNWITDIIISSHFKALKVYSISLVEAYGPYWSIGI